MFAKGLGTLHGANKNHLRYGRKYYTNQVTITNHPLESWKVHPYWLPEDHMTADEIVKQRESDLKKVKI